MNRLKGSTLYIAIMLLAFLFAGPFKTVAQQQDTTTITNIITKDGNEYNGLIISRTAKVIQLKTVSLGIITIQVSNIDRITSVDPKNIKGGEIWLDNAQDSRYFFSPSSYGLRKGEGYYQNVWIMFNSVAFGITDNFSFGGGLVPLFLFGGAATPMWITPKFSFPIQEDKFGLGGGALIGTIVGADGSGAFGIAYGTSTFGSRDKNITFGLGYGFADGEWSNSPTTTVSGMVRTGKKGYFITENYIIGAGDETVGLLSFGGRRVWRKVSLDFGGIIPVGGDIDTVVIIPWLGIVLPFGNKKENKINSDFSAY